MEVNVFELATRNKYRFAYKGNITVEDLWDLPATALDEIYKKLKKEEKDGQEESLLSVPAAKDVELNHKIEIVRYIVAVKQQEQAKRKAAKERIAQKQKIMAVLAEKQDAALHAMSEDDLTRMLAELED